MENLIVIPARYGSTRFPGKPLVKIAGVMMLERVATIAARAALEVPDTQVVIATDDRRIMEVAQDLGHQAVMTPSDIESGTDRVLAVIDALGLDPKAILNLQGDAPFTPISCITALLQAARASDSGVVTPVRQLSWNSLDDLRAHKRQTPFSGTSCIRRADGRAVWFSKNIIPAIRNEEKRRQSDAASPVLQHLGLYAYKLDALRRFAAAPPSYYEVMEGLEQLRFLELGIDILAIDVDVPERLSSGIDTQADVEAAEEMLLKHGDFHVPLP